MFGCRPPGVPGVGRQSDAASGIRRYGAVVPALPNIRLTLVGQRRVDVALAAALG